MLTIRKEQMKAFERSRMGDFEHRLIGCNDPRSLGSIFSR
jgi:hypothetical protein